MEIKDTCPGLNVILPTSFLLRCMTGRTSYIIGGWGLIQNENSRPLDQHTFKDIQDGNIRASIQAQGSVPLPIPVTGEGSCRDASESCLPSSPSSWALRGC